MVSVTGFSTQNPTLSCIAQLELTKSREGYSLSTSKRSWRTAVQPPMATLGACDQVPISENGPARRIDFMTILSNYANLSAHLFLKGTARAYCLALIRLACASETHMSTAPHWRCWAPYQFSILYNNLSWHMYILPQDPAHSGQAEA